METNMDYNTVEPKSSGAGKAVLGLILSFIMIPLLVINGYFISLKSTILKGDSINDLLDNCNFYSTVQEVVIDELYNNAKALGLSRDALNDLFPENTLSDAAENITNAITSNESIDLSYLKDDCMDIAKSTADAVTDTVFESFESSSKTFDVTSLTSNTVLKQFEEDYNVTITDSVVNGLESTYGTTTIDLSAIDSSEIKASISETLTEKVYPAIDNVFDEYITEANNLVNQAIREFNDNYHMNDMFKIVEKTLDSLYIAICIMIIIVLALFAIQLLLYRPYIYKAFKNFSITALISGIIILISGMFILFIKDMILSDLLDSYGSIADVITDFVDSNLSSVNNMIIAVGVVYIILFIICIIISSLIKKYSKRHLQETGI